MIFLLVWISYHVQHLAVYTFTSRPISLLVCTLIFFLPHNSKVSAEVTMLGGSLVTTAWRVLRLRMEGSPPGTEGSCEYTE